MTTYFACTLLCALLLVNSCLCYEFEFVHPHTGNHLRESAESLRQLFNQFVDSHERSYENEMEHERRFEIFKQNLAKIEQLNREEKGTAKYGVTKFADLSPEEFEKLVGTRPEMADENEINSHRITVDLDDEELPSTFDWRDKGAVTEVKDQGFCGSCWAFSVTGNIEGQNKLKRGQLISLSEQELVDCDKKDSGCGGGFMVNAYQSVKELGGLETESDYPYDGYLSEGCSYNKSLVKVTIDSYVVLPKNETQMAQWLVKNGPISVGLNAGAMQFYMRGISHPWRWTCSPKKMNHGVLIVGYGEGTSRWSKKVLPYWIIKNSWGSSYGRKGYYLLYRGDNSCGINSYATSAVINN